MKTKLLEGKVAIVTGAAHGIGRSIAETFAEEGAHVVVADLDDVAGQELQRHLLAIGSGKFVQADVSNKEAVAEVVAAAAALHGRIDILVNNAAWIGAFHKSGDAPDEEWRKCMDIVLMGTQYFTQAVLPYMQAQHDGRIIIISSVQGMVGGRDSAAYTTVKAGLLGFARSVAYDYGHDNIRANVICPGPIRTRISPEPGSELHQRQVSKTMLGRTGEPGDVAYAALFLASDHAGYITGAVIPVDGGWTAI
ncbi:MAG: SDR family NAD(P)-dependent oxidoreductase [Candidatus Sumerlaeaceae bacterium]